MVDLYEGLQNGHMLSIFNVKVHTMELHNTSTRISKSGAHLDASVVALDL